LADLQLTVYPHKWSPVSCMSTAGQGKFAGQRPTFYHCATQPTNQLSRLRWLTISVWLHVKYTVSYHIRLTPQITCHISYLVRASAKLFCFHLKIVVVVINIFINSTDRLLSTYTISHQWTSHKMLREAYAIHITVRSSLVSISPVLSQFISTFTQQAIFVIIKMLSIQYSFTLSLQTQNLPFDKYEKIAEMEKGWCWSDIFEQCILDVRGGNRKNSATNGRKFEGY